MDGIDRFHGEAIKNLNSTFKCKMCNKISILALAAKVKWGRLFCEPASPSTGNTNTQSEMKINVLLFTCVLVSFLVV